MVLHPNWLLLKSTIFLIKGPLDFYNLKVLVSVNGKSVKIIT